ncbi:putative endo-polygalacturonase [Helianthus annuus]|nr:putative endo-polygalacturonase [Helianthus annuus]KAJ0617062.1 putative endo-polygalacturonase [Helianthus annuus]KAJ0778574.1 putative endo-polygalacturonase [Helianthus annuus]KAJ0941542.1 putative endo-polygalacturonase [Helianthus annuus]KAJ0953234.1 putative polygalacturonase [Helianthus annuus]
MVIKHIMILLFLVFRLSSAKVTYNVTSFGAKPDGRSDSKNAFMKAWNLSCNSTSPAVIYVPAGRYLIASALTLSGQVCKSRAITFNIDGTLVAPSSYNAIGDAQVWIKFYIVKNVTINGGTLDAQGSSLWACKLAGKACPQGSTTLGIYHSQNIVISKLRSLNSQMFHILLYGCKNAKIQGVSILAPGLSPNTDGIHMALSTGITILSSKISTGDDCVSMGPGNSNIWIEKVVCGPGHGISIGSLGWELNEPGVQNVTVKTTTFVGTTNGLRIKAWARSSNGFVNGVYFKGATMMNVKFPIIIDGNYCPNNNNCPNEASGVKISNVMYENVHGTSATRVAVKFDCSKGNPCSGIVLKDVDLKFGGQPANSSCSYAAGTASGLLQPTSCL